jgi:hypothetical protein
MRRTRLMDRQEETVIWRLRNHPASIHVLRGRAHGRLCREGGGQSIAVPQCEIVPGRGSLGIYAKRCSPEPWLASGLAVGTSTPAPWRSARLAHAHTAVNAATRDESVAAVLLGEKGKKRRLVALFTVSDFTSGGACPRNLRHEALSPW